MRRTRKGTAFLLLAVLAIGMLVAGAAAATGESAPAGARQIVVEARQFVYDPPVIRVARGERVELVLKSMDVTHGLAVEGYGVELVAIPGRETRAEFVADREGKFRFRCTQTCGTLHPLMSGDMVVGPNRPFWAFLLLAALVPVALVGLTWVKGRAIAPAIIGGGDGSAGLRPTAENRGLGQRLRMDLAAGALMGWLLRRRSLQFILFLPTVAALALVLVAGFAGSPVGSHNLAIVLVWLVWWPVLVIALLPLGGRTWCAVCPIPAPGEWLQRLALVRKREGRSFSLGLRWPRALRNMWLQNLAFLGVASLSTLVFTTPAITAAVLLGFVGLGLVLAVVFSGRSFCRYACPLGGFIGVQSLASPLALRVKDGEVCRRHRPKCCVQGSESGYGCPWFEYPGTMARNAYCGLCMECVKTCPEGNISLGFQAPGHDLLRAGGRLDEAYRAFISVAAVIVYLVVMLGPWGNLKMWAARPLEPTFLLFLGRLAGLSLVMLPGLFLGASYVSTWLVRAKGATARQRWTGSAYALVPLAMTAWMALALGFLSSGGAYVASAVSDPLGRGWDLFGTANIEWRPLFPTVLPYLQAGAILAGLAWSLAVLGRRPEWALASKGRQWLGLAPMSATFFGVTAAFLWLFLG